MPKWRWVVGKTPSSKRESFAPGGRTGIELNDELLICFDIGPTHSAPALGHPPCSGRVVRWPGRQRINRKL